MRQMSRPVLFVIDDDAGVVRALRDDLSRRFGEDLRVIGESSAAAGLATLRGLAGAQDPVALLIVDHDMGEMPGTDFLARAHEMHPLAKRVLLVERDYSARSPIVQAMTLGQADYHITKPWIEALTVCDRRHDRAEQVPAAALFVLIGGEPRTQWLPGTVQLQWGYILTGRDVVREGSHPSRWPLDRAPLPLETSVPGVFAAGDARHRSIKRVASAVGDGAMAVRLVHEYLTAGSADELLAAPAGSLPAG